MGSQELREMLISLSRVPAEYRDFEAKIVEHFEVDQMKTFRAIFYSPAPTGSEHATRGKGLVVNDILEQKNENVLKFAAFILSFHRPAEHVCMVQIVEVIAPNVENILVGYYDADEHARVIIDRYLADFPGFEDNVDADLLLDNMPAIDVPEAEELVKAWKEVHA